MELYPLKVFLTVATERSFSRAGEKLLRTQPAISIAIQRLESDLKEKLIDRSGRELLLTDAGRVVLEFAKRFQNLESELENSLRELKDNYAGRLAIGANETAALYLIPHIEQYRRLFPKVKVQVRRSESSKIPSQLLDGDLAFHLELCSLSGNAYVLEHARKVLLPFFAFVRIRLIASGQDTSAWDRDLEAHQRILDLVREGEGLVVEQYVRQVMARFAATAYGNWEKKGLPGKRGKRS